MKKAEQVELDIRPRYIVSRQFRQFVNGVTVTFKTGQIIEREDQIRQLLDERAPIDPIRDESDIGTCPHCGLSFSLENQRGARELLRRAQQLIPGVR